MSNPIDDTELRKRDYRQYISWQVISLLRSLMVVNDLTPTQTKLIEAKSDLIAQTVKEDIHQYGNTRAVEADRLGYSRGVYDFQNYFMDASMPAQRQPIGRGIAEDLVRDYKYPLVSIGEIQGLTQPSREEKE